MIAADLMMHGRDCDCKRCKKAYERSSRATSKLIKKHKKVNNRREEKE